MASKKRFCVVGTLTELRQRLDHGGLVLADRLHGGHILGGEVEAIALQGEPAVKTGADT